MDKFIVFNGGVFNTRHIIGMTKIEKSVYPLYGIALHVTGDVERQWFDSEDERDRVFNDIISDQLLND